MRRPINWFVFLLSIGVMLASNLLHGSGAGNTNRGSGDQGIRSTAPGMRQVSDAPELERLLNGALTEFALAGVAADAVALPAVSTAVFSWVYSVETGAIDPKGGNGLSIPFEGAGNTPASSELLLEHGEWMPPAISGDAVRFALIQDDPFRGSVPATPEPITRP